MKDSIEVRMSRYLSGEMEAQEKVGFEHEIASEPSLKEAFLAYERIWNVKPSLSESSWNVENGWAEFQRRNMEAPISKSRKYVLYWSIAASIILILGFTYFYLSSPSSKTFLYADTQDGILI
jgi:hypothetical protein